jgi:hypothetical protein
VKRHARSTDGRHQARTAANCPEASSELCFIENGYKSRLIIASIFLVANVPDSFMSVCQQGMDLVAFACITERVRERFVVKISVGQVWTTLLANRFYGH